MVTGIKGIEEDKIKKNREILSKIYNEEEIVDVVLLLSDYIEIEGEENFSVAIVKNDELNDYINDYEIEDEYDESGLYDKLYVTIESEKDLDGIKSSYKKYIDAKLQFRSRLAAVSIFTILYILNIIYKQLSAENLYLKNIITEISYKLQ